METSLINRYLPADYADTFRYETSSSKPVSPDNLLRAVFSRHPSWIKGLFKIREWIVKPLGIRGDNPNKLADMLIEKSADETIIGADDRHLIFYVSAKILPENEMRKVITVTTVVKYHNNLGRVYFFFIRPFHKILVPFLVKRYLKKL